MTPEERFDRIELVIEKNTNGIRDLIVVSRTILTTTEKVMTSLEASQKEVTKQIQELRKAQAETDEKLNILIDTVDRIIRGLGKNGKE
jgi:hypothetical protein